jgi:hypothetical protein
MMRVLKLLAEIKSYNESLSFALPRIREKLRATPQNSSPKTLTSQLIHPQEAMRLAFNRVHRGC